MRFPSAWPKEGLWRHPDFLRLWAAQIVSAWGSRITRTALPIVAVVALDQPAEIVSLMAALQIAPGVALALIAGGLVDRTRKRVLLITADVIRAVLVASLPVAWWLGHLTMAHLIIVGAGVGAATTLFMITDNAYLPALVEKDQLPEGNAKLEASDAVAEIAGPAAGGLLIGILGAPLAVLVDAGTYVWSVIFLSRIENRGEPALAPGRHDVIGDLRVGLAALFGDRILRTIALAQMASYAAGGCFIGLYSEYCLRTLELSPKVLGFVIGAGGVGSLLGALVARQLHARHGLGPTLTIAALISMLGTMLIPLAGGPAWLVLTLLFSHQLISDGAAVVVQVHAVSTQQTLLPREVLGRASAALHVCAISMLPIGALVFGGVAAVLDTRTALWLGLGIGAGAPLAFATLWRIRSLPGSELSGE